MDRLERGIKSFVLYYASNAVLCSSTYILVHPYFCTILLLRRGMGDLVSAGTFSQLINKVEEFPMEKWLMIKTFPRPGPKLVSLYDQH